MAAAAVSSEATVAGEATVFREAAVPVEPFVPVREAMAPATMTPVTTPPAIATSTTMHADRVIGS